MYGYFIARPRGRAEDLHLVFKGSHENPFEIVQSRSGNPNALLEAMERCGWLFQCIA